MRYRPMLRSVLSTTASALPVFRVCFQGDKHMYLNTVKIPNLCTFHSSHRMIPETAIRVGGMRVPSGEVEAIKFSTDDPRFLVLLADQELEAGREEQALALLD